ncbi:hypothetical protein CEP51_001646 [Fusarium floridanum]|uniref:Uncharacterized protein n=1 Tax=Fusarium floridanum TaxID=1325733 RepID=A0A428SFK0_9HYPO|nr:hypothetical protein CEP51_001646 [Fusarium floridanum]
MKAAQYFPHRITSSILLHTNIAVSENGDPISEETLAIAMNFPALPVNADCVMQMAIIPNKIDRFARILFGVDVETQGAFTYLIYPNGTRVFPNPAFTLLDCQENALVPMFGEEPASALTSSEYRKQEIKKGKLAVTGCVSMSIASQADECATFTLNLGLKQASSIRDSLYLT